MQKQGNRGPAASILGAPGLPDGCLRRRRGREEGGGEEEGRLGLRGGGAAVKIVVSLKLYCSMSFCCIDSVHIAYFGSSMILNAGYMRTCFRNTKAHSIKEEKYTGSYCAYTS